MVARFHEGCLHRRVDGQIEEFIFTEASSTAVLSWSNRIESMMVSPEYPDVARWLIDLRLSGPLALNDVTQQLQRLRDIKGRIGEELRIACLTDTQDVFGNTLSDISQLFHINTHIKWFNSDFGSECRPEAIEWLMQNN